MNKVSISLRIDADLAARYEKLAKATERTKSFYIVKALEDSIEQLEYEYGLLKQVEDYRAGKLETYSFEDIKNALIAEGLQEGEQE